MAKKKKEFTAFSAMTKKQKWLNFLKIFGLSFSGVMAMLAGIVLYVWATGGFNPPYVPLTEWAFSQAEYVIDGNKEIEIDENENQVLSQNGNVKWKQKTDEKDNPIYEYVMLVPNEGCTELNATVKIDYYSDTTSPIIQLVEDENTKIIDKDEEDEDKLYYDYKVKIGSPIKIKPLTKIVEINGEEVETNIGGWVRLTATQELLTTYCWVYVDVPVLDYAIEINEDVEQDDDGVYNIYPNSVLSLNHISTPTKAFDLPSTNVPTAKGTTNFSDLDDGKHIYYRVSKDGIINISDDGIITINENKENEEVTITSYVISKYVDSLSEPKLDDYIEYQDPYVPYTKAMQKIRVWSNEITLKINEISVQSLTTGSKQVEIQNYNVFEEGTINFSNEFNTGVKNNYFVDLILTNESDENYKSTLLNGVDMIVGYATESNSDYSSQPIKLNDQELVINGSKIFDASKYVNITKSTNKSFDYVINEYSQNKFYFIFTYTNSELNQCFYDYVEFALNKVELSDMNVSNNVINLAYNAADDFTQYDLSNIVVTLTPTNSTYKNVMFFAPSDNEIIKTDDKNIKVRIANRDCYPVSVLTDEQFDYLTVVPVATGRTVIYAAVMRTMPKYLNGELVAGEYDYIVDQNGYNEIERYSDAINVTITNRVIFSDLRINEGAEFEIISDENDEDYNFAKNCSYFVRLYEGEDVNFSLIYQGTADALENNRLVISHIEGSNQLAASVADPDNSQNENYVFNILANSAGYAKFQIVYDDEGIYTIGVKVLSKELVGLTNAMYQKTTDTEIDEQKDYFVLENETYKKVARPQQSELQNYYEQVLNTQITIDYNAQNNTYCWQDLNFKLNYNSPKTDSTNVELRTYAIPDSLSSQEIEAIVQNIRNYVGKDYTEVISGLDESVNTISKFMKTLSIDENVIKIYSTSKSNLENSKLENEETFESEKYGRIFVNNEEYCYEFVGIGRVLVIAQSTARDVASNAVIVETVCPEIVVKQVGNNEKVFENNELIVEEDTVSYGIFESIDGHITPAKEIKLLGSGVDALTFWAKIGEQEYDITKFVKFRFGNQVVDGEEFVSTQGSNARIKNFENNSILQLANLSENITENIIAYTDFGYTRENFAKYNLKLNYKLTNFANKATNGDSDVIFSTPSVVELFKGLGNAELPYIVVTDANYDLTNIDANFEYTKTKDTTIYTKTTDREIVEGKTYYIQYHLVDNPKVDDIAIYYVWNSEANVYQKLESVVMSGKTFYTFNEQTEQYVQVLNPNISNIKDYYELVSGDYVLATDVEFDVHGDYYTFSENDFVAVEHADVDYINYYFEKSNKYYVVDGNDAYDKVDIDDVNNDNISIYYEMHGKYGNKLYVPNAYDNLAELRNILPAKFVETFYYPDNDYSVSYYHIYPCIAIMQEAGYTVSLAKLTLSYVEEEENLNIYFRINSDEENSNAFRTRTSIKVAPGVDISFNYNSGNVYAINSTSSEVDEFDLTKKISYNQIDDKFAVSVTGVDFAVSSNTSDNLLFVNDSENGNYVRTFTPTILNESDYITVTEYDGLANEEKVGYKLYYIQTNDLVLSGGKTYYVNIDGEFEEYENQQNVTIFFEQIYSKKQFYKLGTSYIELSYDQCNAQYMSKYYELVEDEQESAKYVLTQDKEVDANKTYYYKSNYSLVEEGEELDEIYDILTIGLNIQQSDNKIDLCKFNINGNIKNINESINLTLKVDFKIVDKDSQTYSTKSLNFKIVFE